MTVLCDLDGVVYRGSVALPGAGEALEKLERAGVRVLYITNNSTRTPEAAATKISSLTGIPVDPDQIVSSSTAAAGMMTSEDDPVLVVGEEGVRDAVTLAGLDTTDDPHQANAVLVGLTRSFDYSLLEAAMTSIRSGARFIATNTDPTLPTETGLAPGAGAIVAALSAATGYSPEIAGKPHSPMRAAIRTKGVAEAFVIGDRVDTDVALASGEEDWRSILVLSGVTAADEAEDADADFVVSDLAAAVDLVIANESRS